MFIFESTSYPVTLSSVVLVGLSLELQSTTASTAGELSPTMSRVEHLHTNRKMKQSERLNIWLGLTWPVAKMQACDGQMTELKEVIL